jgi:FMN phosphatase YigB (HAD superfamily)
MIKTVIFDVGETLIDEGRLWRRWAAYLGVAPEVFLAALDATIMAGEHHRRVFDRLRPGFDLTVARRERAARGDADTFEPGDLYPDAAACIRALRDAGFTIGIAGNQPSGTEQTLSALGLGIEIVASSASLGAAKPSPAFFERLAQRAGVPAANIAYVGDRLDNDVLPARAAGMTAVFLLRGPWARIQALGPDTRLAHITIASLAELPGALARITGQ